MAAPKALPDRTCNIELGIPEDGKAPTHVRFTEVGEVAGVRAVTTVVFVDAAAWRKLGSPLQLTVAVSAAD